MTPAGHDRGAFLLRKEGVYMAWSDFGQIVSTVGFPIAACAALFYFMVTMLREHKEEINTLRTALEANTIAITELKGLIENGRLGNETGNG